MTSERSVYRVNTWSSTKNLLSGHSGGYTFGMRLLETCSLRLSSFSTHLLWPEPVHHFTGDGSGWKSRPNFAFNGHCKNQGSNGRNVWVKFYESVLGSNLWYVTWSELPCELNCRHVVYNNKLVCCAVITIFIAHTTTTTCSAARVVNN